MFRMYSIRKWLYKPKKNDPSLLAQFFYADEDLNVIATELDSFDGRKDPERCTALVNQLRACQDKVLNNIQMIMEDAIPHQRANRDFRVKFPDDVVHENLSGQLWFGAECLAAGSSIMNHEIESASMRPLARALTRTLDNLRSMLRDQCLRNSSQYTEKIKDALTMFDQLFAEFELSYVSAMVPVKSMREYDAMQDVIVLFSETVHRAIKKNLIGQDMIDDYDPALMFTIPRLAIVCGLLIYGEGPLNPDNDPDALTEMFRPFQTLLFKIRQLLLTLCEEELVMLEKALCSQHDAEPDQSRRDAREANCDVKQKNIVEEDDSDAFSGRMSQSTSANTIIGNPDYVLDSNDTWSIKHQDSRDSGICDQRAVSHESLPQNDLTLAAPSSGWESLQDDFSNVSDVRLAAPHADYISEGARISPIEELLSESVSSQCSGSISLGEDTEEEADSKPVISNAAPAQLEIEYSANNDDKIMSEITGDEIVVECDEGSVPDSHGACLDRESHGACLDREAHSTFLDWESHGACLDQESHGACLDRESHSTFLDRESHSACLDREAHSTFLDRESHDACLDQESHGACLDRESHGACLDGESHGACLDRESHGACLDRESHGACLDGEAHGACLDREAHGACLDGESHGACLDRESHGACLDQESHGACLDGELHDACLGRESHGACLDVELHGACLDRETHGPCLDLPDCNLLQVVDTASSVCSTNTSPSKSIYSEIASESDTYFDASEVPGTTMDDFDTSRPNHNVEDNAPENKCNHSCSDISAATSDAGCQSEAAQSPAPSPLRMNAGCQSEAAQSQEPSPLRMNAGCQSEAAQSPEPSPLRINLNHFKEPSSKTATGVMPKLKPSKSHRGLLRSSKESFYRRRVRDLVGQREDRYQPSGVKLTESVSSSCSTCASDSDLDHESCDSSDTSSYNSDCHDDEEIALAIQAAELASRNEARSRFRSSSDLIHRLFVCVSGVADQLQTNYASDLRNILRSVFEMHSTESITHGDQPRKGPPASIRRGPVTSMDPPLWVPDSDSLHCTSCKMTFTLVRRRHHCRNCGKIFCSRCSPHFVPLPHYGHTKPVRVCNRCFMFQVTHFTVAGTS